MTEQGRCRLLKGWRTLYAKENFHIFSFLEATVDRLVPETYSSHANTRAHCVAEFSRTR